MAKYLDGFDYDSIHERAREVITNRKRLTPEAKEACIRQFEENCAGSKAGIEKAKTRIPGGVQHNLANNYPFALQCVKADGAYLYDVDGNAYIDFVQAGGPTILGNNYPAIVESIKRTLENEGYLTGLYGEHEYLLAEKIHQYYPSVDTFRMLASGTEADMIAIRLARAYTKKENVIKIAGCYHGWSDQLMYEIHDIGSGTREATGVPADCYNHISAVMPNDIEGLEQAFIENEKRGGTAAFFVEAIGQDSGALPLKLEFHKAARELCDKYNALLIYDEVVTAFRLGMTGAQGFYGIKPDLTVFGKIIAGGLPAAGGVGGRADIMSLLAAGVRTDENSVRVMVGGTMSANPLTCNAGIATIEELERTNAHAKLKEAADQFTKDVADLAEKYGVPALVFNQHSAMHIDVTGWQHVGSFREWTEEERKAQVAEARQATFEFAMAMACEGILVAGGNKSYLNLMTIPELDKARAAIERVFQKY